MTTNRIDLLHVDDVLTELNRRFFDIPFENSDFQNQAFVIGAQHTQGREYRAIGLRMFAKLQAINHLRYERRAEDIDIAEWRSLLNNANEFDRQRLELKIERALAGRDYQNKLLNDAIRELNCLWSALQGYPELTREQFEAEELQHFKQHLTAQLETGGNGALQSMRQVEAFERGQTPSIAAEAAPTFIK